MTDTATADSAQTITMGDGNRIRIARPDMSLRIDVWVEAFDGIYRLLLPTPQVSELEAKCGFVDADGLTRPRGIFAIYGATARGRYELDGEPVTFAAECTATTAECRETVRLALIGGGKALVDGKAIDVTPPIARRLVDNYLGPAALKEAWDLAFIALDARINGRKATPAELAKEDRTLTAVMPGTVGDADNE